MKFIEIRRCGIRKSLYLCGKRVTSWKSTKVNVNEYVKSLGVKMGENVHFITLPNVEYPYSWPVFASEPFVIDIGDNTIISFNVAFITHDGSYEIFKKYIPEKDREKLITLGKIKIGKNCFIGCNSILMPNIEIGDNSVIGAGSIVTKNVPEGEVWAGCPAKFIKKTTELAQKYVEYSNKKESAELWDLYKDGLERYIKAW